MSSKDHLTVIFFIAWYQTRQIRFSMTIELFEYNDSIKSASNRTSWLMKLCKTSKRDEQPSNSKLKTNNFLFKNLHWNGNNRHIMCFTWKSCSFTEQYNCILDHQRTLGGKQYPCYLICLSQFHLKDIKLVCKSLLLRVSFDVPNDISSIKECCTF